jgi:hypothetical protein
MFDARCQPASRACNAQTHTHASNSFAKLDVGFLLIVVF